MTHNHQKQKLLKIILKLLSVVTLYSISPLRIPHSYTVKRGFYKPTFHPYVLGLFVVETLCHTTIRSTTPADNFIKHQTLSED